ncbi:MAG: aminopeptidase P family protein, partial [Bacteroidetes bacterium SW_7_64_58]
RVSRTADDELPEGACVTIEPGVYVPEQNYGVRIEDIVVLRADGSENLTRSPKELMML